MRDMDPRVAALLIGLGIALIAIFNFSRSIGADFQVTLGAVGYSVVVALIAGALCWTPLKPSLPVLVSGTCAALWPGWWKVLDSIAHGGPTRTRWPFASLKKFGGTATPSSTASNLVWSPCWSSWSSDKSATPTATDRRRHSKC